MDNVRFSTSSAVSDAVSYEPAQEGTSTSILTDSPDVTKTHRVDTKPRPDRKSGFYEAFPKELNNAHRQGESTVSNWTGYRVSPPVSKVYKEIDQQENNNIELALWGNGRDTLSEFGLSTTQKPLRIRERSLISPPRIETQLPQSSVAIHGPDNTLDTLSTKQPVSVEQRSLLSYYLQVPIKITSEKEFFRLIAYSNDYGDKFSKAWIVKHTLTEVLQSVLTGSLIEKYSLNVDDLPEAVITPDMAICCLVRECWTYENLPPRLKTDDFNHRCLAASILPANLVVPTDQGDPQNYYADLVNINPNNLKYVPGKFQSFELCSNAIERNACSIKFVKPAVPNYHDLCLRAVKKDVTTYFHIPCDQITEEILLMMEAHSGQALLLRFIPDFLRTPERCFRAGTISDNELIPSSIFEQYPDLAKHILSKYEQSCTESPWILQLLPENQKTETFFEKYLSKWPESVLGCSRSLLSRHPEWLTRSLILNGNNLTVLPDESRRSVELCRLALKAANPCINAVPVKRFEDNPELLLLAAENGKVEDFLTIPDRLKTREAWCAALSAKFPTRALSIIKSLPEAVRQELPYDLLLAVAPQYLPMEIRKEMVTRGDTSLPPAYRQSINPILHQRHLMEPLEPNPFQEFKFTSSVFLKKVLLSCAPFTLRNLALGHALQGAIAQHYQQRAQALKQGQLPVLPQPISRESIIYGGRTLMIGTRDGFTRMKFLRKEESLDDFFREEAVHRFARAHASRLLLKSEVPTPVGVKLVPIDQMPDEILAGFRSTLEKVMINNQPFYLVYEFTTANQDYSTLAHQKDSNGDSTRAVQGLLKACEDLGVWNSLGVVHTSTIQAYHSLKNNRRELFLSFMFNSRRAFPGALTAWDSKATDESDWGYSGLRDIGDIEFYPEITSYFDAEDTKALLPVGYDQRVAFMNAFCENMVAAVLHYARISRDDPDYHYRNAEGRKKLGSFIDQALSAYLSGLIGRPVRVEAYFESPEIYRQWLEKTTAETTLWTARQDLETDCFARSLKETGCYPSEVYPDQKLTDYRYPDDFTSNNQDNLGNNHAQFGLTLLVRGLYQVAAVLAVELGSVEDGDVSTAVAI